MLVDIYGFLSYIFDYRNIIFGGYNNSNQSDLFKFIVLRFVSYQLKAQLKQNIIFFLNLPIY